MNASLLLCGILLGQPAVEPPIVGRPIDWSGAIGGPYVVTMSAVRPELAAEDQLTLTLRIAVADGGSAGNLRDVKRPALAKMEAYKAFAIEDGDDSFSENPPRREFRYTVRPRWASVHEVPRLKFVYFNPRAGRYQTTYSDSPTTLIVTPGVAPSSPALPREVPDWMLESATSEELSGIPSEFVYELERLLYVWFGIQPIPSGGPRTRMFLILAAICFPPATCAVLFAVWRRRHPGAARLARTRRSQAATTALRSLGAASADRAKQVSSAVASYVHARFGLPSGVASPSEIRQALCQLIGPTLLIQSTVTLLERCDAGRFAPAHEVDLRLAADAERLILQWEEQPCSPAGA